MSTRMVKGLHRLTLEKYSLWKKIGDQRSFVSNTFSVGGHQWAVCIFTDVKPDTKFIGRYEYKEGDVYYSLFVRLMNESIGVPIVLKMILLDQSGNGDHLSSSSFDSAPHVISTGRSSGFHEFIELNFLEKSPYLKDDCLKIECVIGVYLPCETETVVPLCGDVGNGFVALLETGEGFDVVFNVRGEKFRAHRMILLARSSVFELMFASHLGSGLQEVVITSVEPQVFKVLLYFIYSDTLPAYEKSLAEGYAFGPCVAGTFAAKLLAAADEYNLEDLKSICESHIGRSISLYRFAETLHLAGKYNASKLKRLCFKYAADNYTDLVELNSFSYLRKNCPNLLDEVDNYLFKEKLKKRLRVAAD